MLGDALRLDTVHHRFRRLPDAQRLPSQCSRERRAHRAGAGQEAIGAWVRTVYVCREERTVGVASEVRERLGELRVVNRGVEPAKDRADIGIGVEILEVELGERVVGGVLRGVGACRQTERARTDRAAEVLDALFLELLFQALHTYNIHLLVLWHLHDRGDVYGGRIRRAKDFILVHSVQLSARGLRCEYSTHNVGLQSQLIELLLIALARLGSIVRDEEYAFLMRAQETEHFRYAFDHTIALP